MIHAGVDSDGTDYNRHAWVVPGGGGGLVRQPDGTLRVCQIRGGRVTLGVKNPASYSRPRTRDAFTVPFEVGGEIFLHSRMSDVFIFGEQRTPTWEWRPNLHPVFVDEDNNVVTGLSPSTNRWSASGQIDGVYGIPRVEVFTAKMSHDAQLGTWHRFRMVVPEVGVHEVWWDDQLVYRVVEKTPPAAWWSRTAEFRAGLRLDFYDYSLRNLTPGDPMTVGNYAEPCYVHPDRYGTPKTNGDDLWFVLHTSEGGETTGSAEALCGYMGQPGDRDNGRGGRYGSSYHVVFDTDCIRPAVRYGTVAYSAGGGNARGRHGCFPGKAGQTREQWLDTNSRAMIRQAAAWLVDQGIGWLYPVTRLSVEQVKASNVHGVCDHFDISRAFGKSTHTDVGPGFPWDVLSADVMALLAVPLPAPTPPPTPSTPPATPNSQEGVPAMFLIVVTNAPTSPVRETVLLCTGNELAHVADGHAADLYKRVPAMAEVRPASALELAGMFKVCRTTTPCPPEWEGTGWQTAWNGARS